MCNTFLAIGLFCSTPHNNIVFVTTLEPLALSRATDIATYATMSSKTPSNRAQL